MASDWWYQNLQVAAKVDLRKICRLYILILEK